MGSIPIRTAMSKRYSESSNQDLKNDSAECLRREWDIVGIKETAQLLLRSVTFFNGDAQQVFGKRKTDMTTHLESQGGELAPLAE